MIFLCLYALDSPSTASDELSCQLTGLAVFTKNSGFTKNSSKLKFSKTCVKRPLSKRPKIDFQDQLSLNAGQKYCRMLQGEHSAILSTFIKLPFVIKIFVLSIFDWPFYTGYTVLTKHKCFTVSPPQSTIYMH